MKRLAIAIAAAIAALSASQAVANTPEAAPPAAWAAVDAAAEKAHGVRISDGEQVVMQVGKDGGLTAISRGPAPDNLPPPSNDPKVETLFQARGLTLTVAPNTVLASFKSFGARGVVLHVENGFDHPIIYDAYIAGRRAGQLIVKQTTICPVRAHGGSFESWGPGVLGIVISNVREPPGDDMHCSGDSGLVTGAATNPNVCQGGDRDSVVQVMLRVDPATGASRDADAVWSPRSVEKAQLPLVRIYFPLTRGVVGGQPSQMVVAAMVSTERGLPKAKTAAIVLIADGVEAARRPWRMYASQLASLERAVAAAPPGSRPVGFFGLIPAPLRADDGTPDPQLERLFTAIGEGKVHRLEVRVDGDDGGVIEQATFDLSSAEIRDAAKVGAALSQAQALAQAPEHCRPPPPPQRAPG
jgi:hypothetical protein